MRELIVKCWDGNPTARPPFTQIIEDLFKLQGEFGNLKVRKSNNQGQEYQQLPKPMSAQTQQAVMPPPVRMQPNPRNTINDQSYLNNNWNGSNQQYQQAFPTQPPPPTTKSTPPPITKAIPQVNYPNPNSPSYNSPTNNRNPPPFAMSTSTPPPSANIVQSITNSFSQEHLGWNDFVNVVISSSGTTYQVLQKLEYLFSEKGWVSKTQFSKVMQWFAPIIADANNSTYANVSNVKSSGTSFEEIGKMVGVDYFHGFISADDAKNILINEQEGSFLIRFSQSPKCYSLSAIHNRGIYHWRINHEPNGKFKIDNETYNSLQDIVDTHKYTPIKIFQLRNTGQEDVILRNGVGRR